MEINIDELYKVLRFHDKEIRSHFEDDSYSDSDYFICAISEDIFQNTINVINCLKSGYELSLSVDNSCRIIIEAFCVLKMRAVGEITDEQLKIYRNHYFLVEYLNLKKSIKESEFKEKQELISKYKQTIQTFCKFYNCKEKDLLHFEIDHPNFYLKKNLKDRINFRSLLDRHLVFDEKRLGLYDFFSLFSHPFFTLDKEAYQRLMEDRNKMIGYVLSYVADYVTTSKLWINNCEESSFDDIYLNNALFKNDVSNIASLNILFKNVAQKSCIFKDGYDLYRILYLDKMNNLIGSIMINFSLGYREQVIVDFKNYIEWSSVDSFIGHCDSEEEYAILRKAFDVSTLLQISGVSGLFDELKDRKLFKEDMNKLYEKYYKEKYELKSFEEFYDNVVGNSLYFIFKDKKSYKQVVRKMLEDIYGSNEELASEIFKAFQISNDFSHAGGYSFNASPGVVDDYSTRILSFVFLHLRIILENIIKTAKEHDRTIEFDQELNYIDTIITWYNNANKQIHKDYSTKAN